MKIIEPSVELLRDFDGNEVLKFIETCGRVCYRSENNITADSAKTFIKARIKSGHANAPNCKYDSGYFEREIACNV